MLQPKIRPVCFNFFLGSHRDLPHSQSPLVLWKFSRNTHSRGILFSTRSSLFLLQQPRSATTLWFVELFFLCRPYVTKYSRHYTRNPQKCYDSCFSWIVSDKEVRKMITTSIVTMNSLFRHNAHQQILMRCKLTGGLEPNRHQHKELNKTAGYDSHTANKTSGRNDKKKLAAHTQTVSESRTCVDSIQQSDLFPTKYHLQILSFKNLKKKKKLKKKKPRERSE